MKASLALLGTLLLVARVPAQTLYTVSEQAGPGATVCVTGDALTPATRFTLTPNSAGGKPGAASVVTSSQANGTVTFVALPKEFSRGVYRITASNGATSSNALYVNRPRLQWADVSEAMPGQVVRIVGRNLSPYGTPPAVTLTNVATKKTFAVPPAYASDAAVKIRVPKLVPPGTYRIGLNNGLAGALSAAPAPLPLTVRRAAPDPFELGVAWGANLAAKVYDAKRDPRLPAHPKGDGKSEDGAAITAGLDYVAAHGGGVLALPAGTYRIDKGDDWLVVRSGTVLRGAGKGKTVLQLGYVATPDVHCPLTLAGGNAAPEGIMDLTVQNLDIQGAPNRILNTYFGDPSRIFLKRVEFRMGNAHEINLSRIRGAVVDGCEFNSPSMTAGTLAMGSVADLRFTNNAEYHRAGRLVFNYGERIVLEGNVIHFDNAHRNASTGETGGVELSFTQRTLLLENEVGALGAPPKRVPGDGEVILTQYAHPSDFLYTGMVKSVKGNVLTNSEPWPTLTWQGGGNPIPALRMACLVVAGKGAGQWRKVIAWDATNLATDTPFAVLPNATSRIVVMPLNNYQHTYVGNRIFGGFYGIEWENGAIDSTAEGNTLTDTGMLGITAYTTDARNGRWGATGSNYSFTAAWNNAILRNTLKNTNGARPATISIASIDMMDLSLGPLSLGNDVRYNTIVGHNTQPIAAQVGKTDGLELISITPDHQFHMSDVLQQGTVLQDNTITNSGFPVVTFLVGKGFFSNSQTGRR